MSPIERAAVLLAGARKVVVLAGAGVSVGAGIPDFRSPGGMYETLRPELLTASEGDRAIMASDPTAVVSWSLFERNSLPYLEVRRPFILGIGTAKWKPTAAHWFIDHLAERGCLARLFQQNIDGLDFQLGDLLRAKLVCVHGSIGAAACEACGTAVDDYVAFAAEVKRLVRDIYDPEGDGPRCSTPVICTTCGAPSVKPATVLYGRSLPAAFFALSPGDVAVADVIVVAGTSLTVGPANSIALNSSTCPRIFIDRERLPCFNAARGDVALVGNADDTVVALALAMDALGDELGGACAAGGAFAALRGASESGKMAPAATAILRAQCMDGQD